MPSMDLRHRMWHVLDLHSSQAAHVRGSDTAQAVRSLVADIVGHSRLIDADEKSTLEALRDSCTQVIDPLFAQHRGRIVKLMGDGILAKFGSVGMQSLVVSSCSRGSGRTVADSSDFVAVLPFDANAQEGAEAAERAMRSKSSS
jgi:class 3 adenylate cyclase